MTYWKIVLCLALSPNQYLRVLAHFAWPHHICCFEWQVYCDWTNNSDITYHLTESTCQHQCLKKNNKRYRLEIYYRGFSCFEMKPTTKVFISFSFSHFHFNIYFKKHKIQSLKLMRQADAVIHGKCWKDISFPFKMADNPYIQKPSKRKFP